MLLIDNFLVWLAEELYRLATQELNDESKLKEQLSETQTLYETGQISEPEYYRKEKELLERLEDIQKEKLSVNK